MAQGGKPDYVAAFLGVVCCGCAYVLIVQQRGGAISFGEQLHGEWEITATTAPTTGESTAAAAITMEGGMTGNSTKTPNGVRVFGRLMGEDENRAFVLETTPKFGRFTVEGPEAGEMAVAATFQLIEPYKGTRIANGWYITDSDVKGRMELTATADRWILHFIPPQGPVTSVIATKLSAVTERSELVDKLMLGFFLFIVAVVVSMMRSALFPAKKKPITLTPEQQQMLSKAAAAKPGSLRRKGEVAGVSPA